MTNTKIALYKKLLLLLELSNEAVPWENISNVVYRPGYMQ